MISQFSEDNHRMWDDHLSNFMLAINSAPQDSTGFSPAYLNFGKEINIPKTLRDLIESDSVENSEINRFEQIKWLKDIFELVQLNLRKAFLKQSKYYNKRRRNWVCSEGDLVMKKDHPLSSKIKGFASKLAPKYSGPYVVVKIVSPVIYQLKDVESGKILPKIHIKELKKAYAVQFP